MKKLLASVALTALVALPVAAQETGSASGGGSAGGSGSGTANEKERELADVNGAWLDTSNLRASPENTDSRMEDGKASDEFEANRKLTGRRATDDEDLYPTRLERA